MKMVGKWGGLLVALTVSTVLGQTPVQEEPVPLPLIGARSIPPGIPVLAQTPKEKAALALRNTFGSKALLNRALFAGVDQLNDNPEEWSGKIDGYGQRFGSAMGRLAIRNSLLLGGDVAFGIDSRYQRCDCSGFLPRTRYAIKRVFVARRDHGGEILHISRLTAAYVSPIIHNQWMPDRFNNWTNRHQDGTMHLAWNGLGNLVREFWPEISRRMPFQRK